MAADNPDEEPQHVENDHNENVHEETGLHAEEVRVTDQDEDDEESDESRDGDGEYNAAGPHVEELRVAEEDERVEESDEPGGGKHDKAQLNAEAPDAIASGKHQPEGRGGDRTSLDSPTAESPDAQRPSGQNDLSVARPRDQDTDSQNADTDLRRADDLREEPGATRDGDPQHPSDQARASADKDPEADTTDGSKNGGRDTPENGEDDDEKGNGSGGAADTPPPPPEDESDGNGKPVTRPESSTADKEKDEDDHRRQPSIDDIEKLASRLMENVTELLRRNGVSRSPDAGDNRSEHPQDTDQRVIPPHSGGPDIPSGPSRPSGPRR